MASYRNYEIEAIRLLSRQYISAKQIEMLSAYSGLPDYEYTGCGYFLSLKQEWLPDIEVTLSEPAVIGSFNEVQCGFVAFMCAKELTLECYTCGEIEIPEGFRIQEVKISISNINVADPKYGIN